MIRSVLASLAGLVLAMIPATSDAGEHAAPAPVPPCPRYGAGFVAVPDSGTCMRLSGRITADAVARTRHERTAPLIAPTGRLSIDTRTDSEYGPVRTFVRVGGRR